MNASRKRDEALLERELLLDLGTWERVSLFKNEVGVGYRRSLKEAIENCELIDAPSRRVVLDILNRFRITYGLGKGSPDLVGHAGGRFVGLELKSETGRLEEDQRKWLDVEGRKGAAVAVIRSIGAAREFIGAVLNGYR